MKKVSSFVRGLSFVVAVAFFGTNVTFAYSTEKNLWSQRRHFIHKENSSSKNADDLLLASLPASSPAPLLNSHSPFRSALALSDDLAKTLPGTLTSKHSGLFAALQTTHGTIRKVWLPSQNAGDRVVVQIQDVHQNEDAQKNIGGAVESLLQAGQVDLVGLEGAFGPIDVKAYHEFEDREAVRSAADCLLRENLVTGPVHSFMTTSAALPLLAGVDDKTHYAANVEAYRRSAPRMDEYKKEMKARVWALGQEKTKVFSEELLKFDAVVMAYKEERANLTDYVVALRPEKGVGNAGMLVRALEMEKELDFPRVEEERKGLIEVLIKKMTQSQIDGLMQESTAYRTGELRFGDFYKHLQILCRTVGVDLGKFPQMDRYIQYVLTSDRIDSERLLDELSILEKKRYQELAKSEKEKDLVAQSNKLMLIGRLLNFSLTPNEWADYESLPMKKDFLSLDLVSFESFYNEAHARDERLASNLLAKMEEVKATRSVIVTGGYHTEGVAERLRQSGVTVVTFTPRIEKFEAEEGPAYLTVFTQEKTPLERLFAGQKLFVTQDPASVHALDQIGTRLAAGAVGVKKTSVDAIKKALSYFGVNAVNEEIVVSHDSAKFRVRGINPREAVDLVVQRAINGELTFHENVVAVGLIGAFAIFYGPALYSAFSTFTSGLFVSLASVPGVSLITAVPYFVGIGFPETFPSFVLAHFSIAEMVRLMMVGAFLFWIYRSVSMDRARPFVQRIIKPPLLLLLLSPFFVLAGNGESLGIFDLIIQYKVTIGAVILIFLSLRWNYLFAKKNPWIALFFAFLIGFGILKTYQYTMDVKSKSEQAVQLKEGELLIDFNSSRTKVEVKSEVSYYDGKMKSWRVFSGLTTNSDNSRWEPQEGNLILDLKLEDPTKKGKFTIRVIPESNLRGREGYRIWYTTIKGKEPKVSVWFNGAQDHPSIIPSTGKKELHLTGQELLNVKHSDLPTDYIDMMFEYDEPVEVSVGAIGTGQRDERTGRVDWIGPSNLLLLRTGGKYPILGFVIDASLMALLWSGSFGISISIQTALFLVFLFLHLVLEKPGSIREGFISLISHGMSVALYPLLAMDYSSAIAFSAVLVLAVAAHGIYDSFAVGAYDARRVRESAGEGSAESSLLIPETRPVDFDGRRRLLASETVKRTAKERSVFSPYYWGFIFETNRHLRSDRTSVFHQSSVDIFLALLNGAFRTVGKPFISGDGLNQNLAPVLEKEVGSPEQVQEAVELAKSIQRINEQNPQRPLRLTLTPTGKATKAMVDEAMTRENVPTSLYYTKNIEGTLTFDSYYDQFALALKHFNLTEDSFLFVPVGVPIISIDGIQLRYSNLLWNRLRDAISQVFPPLDNDAAVALIETSVNTRKAVDIGA